MANIYPIILCRSMNGRVLYYKHCVCVFTSVVFSIWKWSVGLRLYIFATIFHWSQNEKLSHPENPAFASHSYRQFVLNNRIDKSLLIKTAFAYASSFAVLALSHRSPQLIRPLRSTTSLWGGIRQRFRWLKINLLLDWTSFVTFFPAIYVKAFLNARKNEQKVSLSSGLSVRLFPIFHNWTHVTSILHWVSFHFWWNKNMNITYDKHGQQIWTQILPQNADCELPVWGWLLPCLPFFFSCNLANGKMNTICCSCDRTYIHKLNNQKKKKNRTEKWAN